MAKVNKKHLIIIQGNRNAVVGDSIDNWSYNYTRQIYPNS